MKQPPLKLLFFSQYNKQAVYLIVAMILPQFCLPCCDKTRDMPHLSIRFSCSLEANNSADPFGRNRSPTRLFNSDWANKDGFSQRLSDFRKGSVDLYWDYDIYLCKLTKSRHRAGRHITAATVRLTERIVVYWK